MLPARERFAKTTFPGLPPPAAIRRMALLSPGAIFLDSSLKQPGYGERDILLLDPAFKLILPRDALNLSLVVPDEPVRQHPGNPFDVIESLLVEEYNEGGSSLTPPLLAGYISYEAGRFAECMPAPCTYGPNLPDIYLVCPKTIVIADSIANSTIVYSASTKHLDIETMLSSTGHVKPIASCPSCLFSAVQSSLPLEPYISAVERTIEYIRTGDIYQANITRQLFIDNAPDATAVYQRLAELSPAPYSAWIDLGCGNAVLSSSMELFLRVKGREVISRPIKGTVRRGTTPEEDRAFQSSLRHSAKDLAELTMIIDVERNDIGRICQAGKVTVPDLYRLETFPYVHHLVSTVRGELRDDVGIGAILRATLPGGSITGAPKVRAMEIIGELEPMRRSVYTGAIGWFDSAGNAELNVAIRTIMMESGRAWFPAGGGIVADSVPIKEYEETLHKVRGMALALGIDWPAVGAHS